VNIADQKVHKVQVPGLGRDAFEFAHQDDIWPQGKEPCAKLDALARGKGFCARGPRARASSLAGAGRCRSPHRGQLNRHDLRKARSHCQCAIALRLSSRHRSGDFLGPGRRHGCELLLI